MSTIGAIKDFAVEEKECVVGDSKSAQSKIDACNNSSGSGAYFSTRFVPTHKSRICLATAQLNWPESPIRRSGGHISLIERRPRPTQFILRFARPQCRREKSVKSRKFMTKSLFPFIVCHISLFSSLSTFLSVNPWSTASASEPICGSEPQWSWNRSRPLFMAQVWSSTLETCTQTGNYCTEHGSNYCGRWFVWASAALRR